MTDQKAGAAAVQSAQTQPMPLDGAPAPPVVVPPYTGPRSQEPRERIILMVPPDLKRAIQDLARREARSDNATVELLVRRGLLSWPSRSILDEAVS